MVPIDPISRFLDRRDFAGDAGHLQESLTQREAGILDPKGSFPGPPGALRDDYDASITTHHAPARMNLENRLWAPSVSNNPLGLINIICRWSLLSGSKVFFEDFLTSNPPFLPDF